MRNDQRGVILIQVALMLVVIVGFSAMAVDYGVLLLARSQAQNGADAGALAAATAVAFDSMAYGDEGRAQESARTVASSMSVFGQTPGVETAWLCDTVSISGDPSSYECPQIPGFPPPPFRTFFGATVRVFRNGEQQSTALPTYFANVFGVSTQGARAQATAVAVPANTSTCVWPVAIPDIWREVQPAGRPGYSTQYVRHSYADVPDLVALAYPLDEYGKPPTYLNGDLMAADFGPTGLSVTTNDFPSNTVIYHNELVVLKKTVDFENGRGGWPQIDDPTSTVGGGAPVAVAIPRTGGGGFEDNLASCNRSPVRIGQDLAAIDGVSPVTVAQAAATKIASDGPAYWDTSAKRVRGSCASANPPCSSVSPRLVVVPIFDPEVYDATRYPGPPTIRIVNFAGFFITATAGNQVQGYLTTYPGSTTPGTPVVQLDYSPLRAVLLAR